MEYFGCIFVQLRCQFQTGVILTMGNYLQHFYFFLPVMFNEIIFIISQETFFSQFQIFPTLVCTIKLLFSVYIYRYIYIYIYIDYYMGDSGCDLYSRVMNISRTRQRSERVSEMFITSEYKSYPLGNPCYNRFITRISFFLFPLASSDNMTFSPAASDSDNMIYIVTVQSDKK